MNKKKSKSPIPQNRIINRNIPITSELIDMLFDTTHIHVALIDRDATIVRVNRGYEITQGQICEYFKGRAFFEIFPDQHIERIFHDVIDSGSPYSAREDPYEYESDPERGTEYWNWDMIPVPDRHGVVVAVIIISVEVTSRKRAQDLNIRLAEAIEHIDEGVMVTDSSGIINYVNPSLCEETGYELSELRGKAWDVLEAKAQSSELTENRHANITHGKAWSGRVRRRRKNGSLYEADMTVSPVKGKGSELSGFVSLEHDVTEKLRIEEGIRQVQKMEALGTLASGIAHDFNNILMPVVLNSEMLKDDLTDNDVENPLIEQILQAARRGQRLIRQILAFSRHDEQARHPMHLISVIDESLELIRASLPSDIRMERKIRTTRDIILGDSTQLQQVIMNLCKNAADALEGDRRIILITLSDTELREKDIMAEPGVKPGSFLKLSVSDTGIGIDPAIRDRIFEPFFTLKDNTEGSGMGLAVVHGIVKNHGGMITVQSQLGSGTTFSVFFPQLDQSSIRGDDRDEFLPTGTESILVVDDEALVAGSLVEALKRLGYKAAAVTDGMAAVGIFNMRPDVYDLLICDQSMPEVTGIDLVERIREIRSDVPAILCTGYPGMIDRVRCGKLGINQILIKPVNTRDLAVTIRKALGENTEK